MSQALESYYRLHARIYDATRWSFLFGRTRLVNLLDQDPPPKRILEIGCGTGKNLRPLCHRFPAAAVSGVDLSEEMLTIARRNLTPCFPGVTLIHQSYHRPLRPAQRFDLILFSYSLSMINPGYRAAIESARKDLHTNGRIAVVDFHDSRLTIFKRWMGLNHVRLDSHLIPTLEQHFIPEKTGLRNAYGGLWRWFHFIGRPKPNPPLIESP